MPRKDRWVEKGTALRTLAEIGKPCSAEDFGRALTRQRFRVNGTDNRAYNILDRLRRQGLVARSYQTKSLNYELPTRSGTVRPIRRTQACAIWSVTPKGRARIKHLEENGR